MRLPFLAAAALIALAGCTTTGADAEKALTLAHLAYQGVGIALEQAAESGALHGADAARAQALYDQAGAALDAGDAADAQADIAALDALLPKH